MFQIVPSVLFVLSTISLQLVDSRRLTDDIDNEINSPMSYVKIIEPPKPIIKKKVGDHVELTCEGNGSPPPVIQWYRRNQRLTEVSIKKSNSYILLRMQQDKHQLNKGLCGCRVLNCSKVIYFLFEINFSFTE